MTLTRKRYDRQFKTAAAQVVISREKSVRELSEELGMKDSTLRRWAHEYEQMGSAAFPGNGSAKINKDYQNRQAQETGRGARERERAAKKIPGLPTVRPCVRYRYLTEHRGEFTPLTVKEGVQAVQGVTIWVLRVPAPTQVEPTDRTRSVGGVHHGHLHLQQGSLRVPEGQP